MLPHACRRMPALCRCAALTAGCAWAARAGSAAAGGRLVTHQRLACDIWRVWQEGWRIILLLQTTSNSRHCTRHRLPSKVRPNATDACLRSLPTLGHRGRLRGGSGQLFAQPPRSLSPGHQPAAGRQLLGLHGGKGWAAGSRRVPGSGESRRRASGGGAGGSAGWAERRSACGAVGWALRLLGSRWCGACRLGGLQGANPAACPLPLTWQQGAAGWSNACVGRNWVQRAPLPPMPGPWASFRPAATASGF